MDLRALKKRFELGFKNFKNDIFMEEKVQQIEAVLIKLASDPRVLRLDSKIGACVEDLLNSISSNDNEQREASLIDLYLCLHKAGASYNQCEQRLMDEKKGLKWLPGGIMPVVFASYIMKPQFTFVDLGAGNGLQGLMLQYISPHRLTRQIELSGSHLNTGRIYRKVLGIHETQVSFENADIFDSSFYGVDVFYMYRPARPMGEGINIYKNINAKLLALKNPFFLISVADCFEPFITMDYKVVYSNEFLKIFYFSLNGK